MQELVRHATLAASGQNTQPWRFAVKGNAIEIQPRTGRRGRTGQTRGVGDDVSLEKPLLDARLPDGSRVAAVFPPCSLNGASMAIRKFQSKVYTAEQLIRVGAVA